MTTGRRSFRMGAGRFWPRAVRRLLAGPAKSRRLFTLELHGRKAPFSALRGCRSSGRKRPLIQVPARVRFRPIAAISLAKTDDCRVLYA